MTDARRLPARDGEVGEGSKAFEFTTPIRLDQLNYEVTKKMGWRNAADLSADGSLSEASEETPAVVWVGRGEDLDTNAFLAAVREHEADAAWFDPSVISPDQSVTVEEVRAKAQSGYGLTPEEVQVALRYLLTQD